MSFKIGKNGIDSIKFEVSMDRNSTIVQITKPYEDDSTFYREQSRIGQIFGATVFSYNYVEVNHGRFSGTTFSKLKKSVAALKAEGLIDSEQIDVMLAKLQQMVAQVKVQYEQETKKFEVLLADYKEKVSSQYNVITIRDLSRIQQDGILIDDSIYRLNLLINTTFRYRGNPTKVGCEWVHLFLSEGALESLIKALEGSGEKYGESSKKLTALREGVTSFLQKYEAELHKAIQETISDKAKWFQQLYADYQQMVEHHKTPESVMYGPITNMPLGVNKLFLPKRFDKS